MKRFRFDGLWDGTRWIEKACVSVDEQGLVHEVSTAGAQGAEAVAGWALPGVPNAHSHAFQFALAGLAEHVPVGRAADDFWSWREAMYELALEVGPESLEAIASFLYGELAARGFTSVAEFHYLHHRPDGKPYADQTTLAECLCRAAKRTGMRLTLVPVHYRFGDFGKPASVRQKRFLFSSAKEYLDFASACAAVAGRHGCASGGGVHSLRASAFDETKEIFAALPREWPRHLHIAEQKKEVEACRAACGKTPLRWALDELPLDRNFHLVHATHGEAAELREVARRGANVVLCPTTEGNLGDGLFDLVAYSEAGGRFSIGTDSHVGIDPWEELRLLDYGQRLRTLRRNPLVKAGESSGEKLLREVVSSGARAVGQPGNGFFKKGDPFDAAVVASDDPFQNPLRNEWRVDTRIYAGGSRPLLGTIVAGKWVAREGRHVAATELAAAARAAFANRK